MLQTSNATLPKINTLKKPIIYGKAGSNIAIPKIELTKPINPVGFSAIITISAMQPVNKNPAPLQQQIHHHIFLSS